MQNMPGVQLSQKQANKSKLRTSCKLRFCSILFKVPFLKHPFRNQFSLSLYGPFQPLSLHFQLHESAVKKEESLLATGYIPFC